MNRCQINFSLWRLSALLFAGSIIAGCSLRQPNPSKQSFLLEPVRAGEARALCASEQPCAARSQIIPEMPRDFVSQ